MSVASALAIDPVLDALRLALQSHHLGAGEAGSTLFLRARADGALRADMDAHWTCQQSLKPLADALGRSGLSVVSEAPAERFARVIALPPRQRQEARAVLARAVASLAPGGVVIACMPNTEGAKSGEADLRRLVGGQGQLSKHKCRVFWARPGAQDIDHTLLAEWLALDEVQPILDGRYVSRPGLFAWDRIDAASSLLAAQWPSDLHGRAADLGAGWGYLSCQLLTRCAGIERVDLFEAEGRAIEPARRNTQAAAKANGVDVNVHWHDVTAGLPAHYQVIIANPPFHQHGRADLPALGQAFIRSAAQALAPDGRFWMVANRHLPYEATLAMHFSDVQIRAQADGFKVFEARGARA
ncbi:methyltransferase [Oleiagrimonas sp. C23AA]|uniref:class I SAM-dependent methyltransferase n=1 Tax=Oleiagrimonas sp. C23AA TaxID=2719047 RepID=UPI001422EAA3|nr:methyltransferase [Oleiagrimonas sp. C23AA]NII09611.1 class I SAM-dependent methyltransferase [Oleiagrimonas sp. C23AA]